MAIQAHFGPSLGSPLENACGFDHSCLLPQQQFNHQKNLNYFVDNNAIPLLPNTSFNHQNQQSLAFFQSVSANLEKQRKEFEEFINFQNERLRLAILEQRKQQTSLLMKKYESKIQFLLKQKDEEMAKATNRTAELQNFLKRMESENQTWQRVAKENEAMVTSLNSKIERLRESACLSSNAADDAGSCCINRQEEDGTEGTAMICRCCNWRKSCVVVLPCRHLCACRDCEVFLDACPVCRTVKKGSIEALI